MAELNALPARGFAAVLGGVFEHSAWIPEAAAEKRPFANREELLAAMTGIIAASGEESQLALIRAHPDLAGRLARQGLLTPESAREQAAAGLADGPEAAAIGALNTAYRERFGFPFVICARLNDAAAILAAMRERLNNRPAEEIATALTEISKIARLRLADIVEETP